MAGSDALHSFCRCLRFMLEMCRTHDVLLVPSFPPGVVLTAICPFLQVDLVVLGSRGMGSFKRSLMSFVGLGSVSDYCVHNLPCPVLVIKAEADKLPAAAASGAAQPAAAVAAEVAGAAAAAAPAKED